MIRLWPYSTQVSEEQFSLLWRRFVNFCVFEWASWHLLSLIHSFLRVHLCTYKICNIHSLLEQQRQECRVHAERPITRGQANLTTGIVENRVVSNYPSRSLSYLTANLPTILHYLFSFFILSYRFWLMPTWPRYLTINCFLSLLFLAQSIIFIQKMFNSMRSLGPLSKMPAMASDGAKEKKRRKRE